MPRPAIRARMVRSGLAPPEVTAKTDAPSTDLFMCPECGREYKTETGRDNHVADKH
jgi:hypothetical protein